MTETTVAVIGGGISGLSAAWQLATCSQERVRVVLFEAQERLGGKLRTTEFAGRRVDLGPDAFLVRRDEALSLCVELGLAPELVEPATGRSLVFARGRLRPLPSGLALGVPTDLGSLARSGICSVSGIGRVALDLIPLPSLLRNRNGGVADGGLPEDEAVGSVVLRRLGRQVHDRLADPLVGGIHAGPIDTMSAAAVFPQLLRADRLPGSLMRNLRSPASSPAAVANDLSSRPRPDEPRAGVVGDAAPRPAVFMSLSGGLERLVQRLSERLEERGVVLRRGTSAERLERRVAGAGRAGWSIATKTGVTEADAVVMAVPAGAAAGLLRPHDAALAGLLDQIPYGTVSVVTMRFVSTAAGSIPEGTGFLVPADTRRLVTACTFLSSKWAHLSGGGDVVLRASAGRHGDDRSEEMSDDQLVGQTVEELRDLLHLSEHPVDTVVKRWPHSFPQYLVGHLQRARAIETRASSLGGLAMAGAALHGVGIPACIASGRNAALAVVGSLVG